MQKHTKSQVKFNFKKDAFISAYKRKLERLKDLGIITEVGIHTMGQVSCSHTQGRQINTPMP